MPAGVCRPASGAFELASHSNPKISSRASPWQWPTACSRDSVLGGRLATRTSDHVNEGLQRRVVKTVVAAMIRKLCVKLGREGHIMSMAGAWAVHSGECATCTMPVAEMSASWACSVGSPDGWRLRRVLLFSAI